MNGNNKQKQYIVVGLGRFGCAIAETLCQEGVEVLKYFCILDDYTLPLTDHYPNYVDVRL